FGQNGSILGGGITIESGTVNILNKALGGAGIDGGLITLGDAANSGKLAVLNVNGSGFSDVVNQIHVVGTGTRIISATSYSLVHNGAVTLFDGADLYLITNNPNGSQLNFYGSVSGTGNLVVQANSANANGNSWIRLLTNSVDIDGTITNNGAGSSGNLSRLETQISAVIGDKVRGVVQDSVNSALTLSGSNIYRGDTQVLQGTLNLGNVYAVQNSTVNLSAGVMLGLTVGGGANTYYLGGLAGDSNVNVGANSLNVGANNASTVYNGALVGNGNLTKVGAGTLTLTGASTYDGNTTISGGVLLVNGSGELTNTGGVYVNTGGTFRYDSVVAFGRGVSLDGGAFHYNSAADMDGSDAVLIFNSGKLAGTNWNGAVLSGLTINTGKVIAPGNSIGIAGTESQTWGVGGAYEFELGNVSGAAGADWDLLNVSGVLDISSLSASSFTLQLTGLGLSGFNAGQNYDWDFVHFASLTGVFDGDLFTVDAVGFGAAYDGEFSVIQSGGNILALHYEAIPEPSVLALLGIGGVILLIARRRK
ncbi:MAG: autotransporter-associated beta strand repeat-containing protein, partial [Verrucomicrobiales bacterium]|nr:autotransporter-associated beta strand repeat-containing protein [Verrucomicrobiales bacterium]